MRIYIIKSVLLKISVLFVLSIGVLIHSAIAANLDPSFIATNGFNNPPYSEQVPLSTPVDANFKGRVESFTAPNNKKVTITVQSPIVTKTYNVPPIQSNQDPAQYFASAITQAGSGSTIIFPPNGVYNFNTCSKGPHLPISNLSDVIIEGNGSALNFPSLCPGVALINSKRVVLKNFTLDWPHLQVASLATITGVGGHGPKSFTYDIQLDSAYVTAAMPKTYKAINTWDFQHNQWSLDDAKGGGSNPPQALSDTGRAQNIPSWNTQYVKGERILVRHYTTEGDALDVYDSQDVTLQNIAIYSSPGFGISVLKGSSGLVVSNCKITRSNGRPISTAADALHISNNGGNIIIENNLFAYEGDDGININTRTFAISRGGSNELSIPADYGYLQKGDVVALFNANMMHDNRHIWQITDITPNSSDHTNTLTLDQPIPESDSNGFLVDLNYASARYIIRNNQFLYSRARGALLQTAYGLVEGNTFTGQVLFPLLLGTYPPEGPGVQNVSIINNKMSESGINGGPAAVVLDRGNVIYGNPATTPPIHQNILFAGNVISDVPGAAFYISSANNVVLDRNVLQNTNSHSAENIWNNAGNLNYSIIINDASNIALKQNSIPSSGFSPISIDTNTTTGIRAER